MELQVLQNVSTILFVFGILAFITSIIVQSIKEMPYLKDIPTSLVALIVSELITVLGVFSFCAYKDIALEWYFCTSSVIAGFFVYMIATGGWEKIHDIWERTKYKDNNEGLE
jgi:Ca2+/Na+ antiporter